MKTVDYLIAIVISTCVAALVWAYIAYPRQVESSFEGPLKSASFAPFRDGQSPMKEIFPTPEQIEEDLILLKGVFSGIRTYTSLGGMEVVPALAAKHGFHLTHSAWIGREPAKNTEEVDALIKAANDYPDAVNRLIVGNEVLLRNDLSPDELIANIDRVQAAVKQPVSYADVWAFWLKYPQVAEHVDFITIHILPYWEDEPVSVEESHQHLIQTINMIKARFPGKPILVGETGWPTQGRSRGPAAANLVNAAEYVRKLPALAQQYDFDYNIVEAFDQTWKARNEGTVGARWGLFNAQRELKFGFSGAVNSIDNPKERIVISLVLGIIFSLYLITGMHNKKHAVLVCIGSQLLAASVVYSVYTAIQLIISPASFTWVQQHWLFYAAAKNWITEPTIKFWYQALLMNWVDIQAHIWGYLLVIFNTLFCLAALLWIKQQLQQKNNPKLNRIVASGYGLYAIGAMVFSFMFALSGRYMDMPIPHFMIPLSVALLAKCIHHFSHTNTSIFSTRCQFFNRYAKVLLTGAALYCIYGEATAMMNGQDFINMHPTLALQIPLLAKSILANHELLLWCAMCIALSFPVSESDKS